MDVPSRTTVLYNDRRAGWSMSYTGFGAVQMCDDTRTVPDVGPRSASSDLGVWYGIKSAKRTLTMKTSLVTIMSIRLFDRLITSEQPL